MIMKKSSPSSSIIRSRNVGKGDHGPPTILLENHVSYTYGQFL